MRIAFIYPGFACVIVLCLLRHNLHSGRGIARTRRIDWTANITSGSGGVRWRRPAPNSCPSRHSMSGTKERRSNPRSVQSRWTLIICWGGKRKAASRTWATATIRSCILTWPGNGRKSSNLVRSGIRPWPDGDKDVVFASPPAVEVLWPSPLFLQSVLRLLKCYRSKHRHRLWWRGWSLCTKGGCVQDIYVLTPPTRNLIFYCFNDILRWRQSKRFFNLDAVHSGYCSEAWWSTCSRPFLHSRFPNSVCFQRKIYTLRYFYCWLEEIVQK